MQFRDALYGKIELPDWLSPFLRLPEFARLRGVRLSNVDSWEFKDFGATTRWEHGVATAFLATIATSHARFSRKDRIVTILAALLHDVATPPFAHTLENVLPDFNHEHETSRLLNGELSDYVSGSGYPVYADSPSSFIKTLSALAKHEHISLTASEIAEIIHGEGYLGYLVSGTLDLDNADNVTRGSYLMGLDVDRTVPKSIALWLGGLCEIPLELPKRDESFVKQWLSYKDQYYSLFYFSTQEELARQAFLHHIFRRAWAAGIPRDVLLWNTDAGVLEVIAGHPEQAEHENWPSLRVLVNQYRLLENPFKFMEIEFDDPSLVRHVLQPAFTAWLEHKLSAPFFEPMIFVQKQRTLGKGIQPDLFVSVGRLLGFKIGDGIQRSHLPDWLRTNISPDIRGDSALLANIQIEVKKLIEQAVHTSKWHAPISTETHVRSSLLRVKDWGFRSSRNELLLPYPGSFVHAIPAALIAALGIRGETIFDPFCGTGQTGAEAIKLGCDTVLGDQSYFATLACNARFTFYPQPQLRRLHSLTIDDLKNAQPIEAPDFPLRDKWHHPDTLLELCQIIGFINDPSFASIADLLRITFAAIVPLCTERKGRQHGWFADNTPLPSGVSQPSYQPALETFIRKLNINIGRLQRFYATFERQDQNVSEALSRSRVFRRDALHSQVHDYGVREGAVAAIITSPPYLCMADYTLGQRLAYQWLAPKEMDQDFRAELAPRRARMRHSVLSEYLAGMRAFANLAHSALRDDGYLCMVLGEPTARRFEDVKVMEAVDDMLNERGFNLIWETTRTISWHRNHGVERLKNERITVFQKKGGF